MFKTFKSPGLLIFLFAMFTNNELRKLRFQTPSTATNDTINATLTGSTTTTPATPTPTPTTLKTHENLFEHLNKARQRRRLEWEAEEEEARKTGKDRDFVGLCQEMCPEWERHEREVHLDVNKFERLVEQSSSQSPTPTPTQGQIKIDHSLAVKKYHRPAAGNEAPLPEEVRPPAVLRRTLDYLIDSVLLLDSSFADRHKFIRDRTRAIRQDVIMQQRHINKSPSLLAMVIEMHEEIARFHILSSHLLSSEPLSIFDPFQNTEQLRKVLQSLIEFYSILPCPASEGEFRSYYMISHGRDESIFWQVESLSPPLNGSIHCVGGGGAYTFSTSTNDKNNNRNNKNNQNNRNFYNSVTILKDMHSRNWSSFIRGFHSVPYLTQCLLLTHLPMVRGDVIRCLKKSHLTTPSSFIPLKVLKDFLLVEEDDCSIADFISYFGLSIRDGKVFCCNEQLQLQQHQQQQPSLPPPILKPSSKSVQNVVRGIVDGEDLSFVTAMMLDELLQLCTNVFLTEIARTSIINRKNNIWSRRMKDLYVQGALSSLWSSIVIDDLLLEECSSRIVSLKMENLKRKEKLFLVERVLEDLVLEVLEDESVDIILNYPKKNDFECNFPRSKVRRPDEMQVIGVDVSSLLKRIEMELQK